MRRLVCPVGFGPTTYGLEIRCSIQLSYGHILFQITIALTNLLLVKKETYQSKNYFKAEQYNYKIH